MFDLLDLADGEAWMKAAIRCSLVAVSVRWIYRLRTPRISNDPPSLTDVFSWAIGYIFYVVHVLLAFAYPHDWSHTNAWNQTAEETARVTGIARGEGVWINYALILVWGLDVLRILHAWRRQAPTSRRIDASISLGMAFLWFNATVVFGPSFYRWLFIPLLMVMIWAWKSRSNPKEIPPLAFKDVE